MATRPPLDLDLPGGGIPDPQTVTPAGERLDEFIDGVRLRSPITHSDERGSLTEVFDPAWGFSDDPVVYVYEARIHPGQKKGWVVHGEQDDRLYFRVGSAKVVLYDARSSSPTRGLVQELFVGAANPALVRIPAGVVHAVVNVGPDEVMFVNMPTRPYRHERPDKIRFPSDTDAIPYDL